MNKRFRSALVYLIFAIGMVACTPSNTGSGIQRPTVDEVATVVALTLQAPTPEVAVAPTNTNAPEASPSLLPHSLYFLGKDNEWVSQVYRLERDGKTKTQLTFEPVDVDGYDVSLADGSVAYIVN